MQIIKVSSYPHLNRIRLTQQFSGVDMNEAGSVLIQPSAGTTRLLKANGRQKACHTHKSQQELLCEARTKSAMNQKTFRHVPNHCKSEWKQ